MSLEKGTLEVLLITKFGIVIAGDSRNSRPVPPVDNAQKIYQLSDHSVCALAGWVGWQRQFLGEMRGFNFPEAVREYRERRPVPGIVNVEDDAQTLADTLVRNLFPALMIRPFFGAVPPLSEGDILATLLVAGYTEANDPSVTETEAYKLGLAIGEDVAMPGTLTFQSRGQELSTSFNGIYLHPELPIFLKTYLIVDPAHDPFALFTNGNAQVVRAILADDPSVEQMEFWAMGPSNKLRFEDFRKHVAATRQVKAIARYLELSRRGELGALTLPEATDLANALVEQSIKVAGDQLGIGGQIDMAQITIKNGFRWVPGHDPALKRQRPL
jgi:hypothetical protein